MDAEEKRAISARRHAREQERSARRRRDTLVLAACLAGVALLGAAVWGTSSLGGSARRKIVRPARAATRDGSSASASAPSAPKVGPQGATATPAATAVKPYDWAHQYGLIAHGFGSIGGLSVTSSREAFDANYKRGYRIFEVDLVLTKDGFVVGRHDWSPSRAARYGQTFKTGSVPTRAEYLGSLIKGRYHPVDATAVVELMRRHPDAWVMTDIKIYTVAGRVKALRQLIQAAGNDPAIRRRLIVQIYEENDLKPTRALGIDNILYTFYRLNTPVARALDFAKRNDVRVVTIPVSSASTPRVRDIREHGLICAVHTVNDPKQVPSLRLRGVGLLYSDSLEP